MGIQKDGVMKTFATFVWSLVGIAVLFLFVAYCVGSYQQYVQKEQAIAAMQNAPQANPPDISTALHGDITNAYPEYDTARYCKRLGDMVGGSNDLELTCVQQENDAAKDVFAKSVTVRTMNYCDGLAKNVGGSYELLETCIEQENKAASRLSAINYK